MAFSFFRKNKKADLIITGGKIRTFDPEYPIASAIAVKDGLISALGEAEEILDEYQGKDTEIYDLEGATLVPGLTDLYGESSSEFFDKSYLKLTEDMSADEILAALKKFVAKNPDAPYCFAYGFASWLFDEIGEEETQKFRAALDEIGGDMPILILSADNLNMRLNTSCAVIVKEAAEELGIEVPTHSFIMQTIVDTDYSAYIGEIMKIAEEKARMGYTSVLSRENSTYFDNVARDTYMNIYQADTVHQRMYGSYTLSRAINPNAAIFEMDKKFTNCQEVKPLINFNLMIMKFASAEDDPHYMSEDYINSVASILADKGYNLRLVPLDREAALTALDIAGNLATRYKKLSFTVVNDWEFTDEELAQVASGGEYVIKPGCALDNVNPAKGQTFGEAACIFLSDTAARILGVFSVAGELADGKRADFTVFKKDPFECRTRKEFEALTADCTFIGGDVAYAYGKSSAFLWTTKVMTMFEDEE